MNDKELAESRLRVILTEEEMERVDISTQNKIFKITINVHQLARAEAKRLIKNVIALIRKMFIMLVIHGYNHGTAIKDMILTDFISLRIEKIEEVENNQGRTVLEVCAA